MIMERAEMQIPVTSKNINTLFNESWRYFTIPAKYRKDWVDDEGCGQYAFVGISSVVKKRYENYSDISSILSNMGEALADETMTITPNEGTLKGHLTDGQFVTSYSHYRCQLSVRLLQAFKCLFISTFVYSSSAKAIPVENFTESFTLLFNYKEQTVSLQNLCLYTPEDPYLLFARKAARHTSFNTAFSLNVPDDEKVRDFYSDSKGWHPLAELETMQEVYDVIYMLYDENSQAFYVGRADKLKERLMQHRDGFYPNEPIQNFTHFRYSVISQEYSEYSYLIENSAIHDSAWLLHMPKAKQYKPSLQTQIAKKIVIGDMNQIKLVNQVEHQTRLRKKK